MKKRGKNFLTDNIITLKNSFKNINLTFLLIIVLDVLFYFILFQAGNYYLSIMQQKALGITLDQNLLADPAAASGLLETVRGFFFFLVASIIIFLLITIIVISLLKGVIWSLTVNKKLNLEFFKKFLILNLIWIPSWFLLAFLATVAIREGTAPLFVLVIFILTFYFTNILYPLFLKQNKLAMIKTSFSLGIRKIHYFIIPFAIIIISSLIISRIYNLIALNINLNPNVLLLIGIIYVAWLRYYFVEVVGNL